MRGIYEKPIDSGIWWIQYYADAVAAFETVRVKRPKPSEPVFPRQGATFDMRSWFHPFLRTPGSRGMSGTQTAIRVLFLAGATFRPSTDYQ
jgi:hypothetical protein